VTHTTFRKLAVILSDGDWLFFEYKSFHCSSFYNLERNAVPGEVSMQLSANRQVWFPARLGKKSESETSGHDRGLHSSIFS